MFEIQSGAKCEESNVIRLQLSRGLKFGRFFLVEHMPYGYTRTARI